ncbi:MAG: uroporphyrinogen decarboxylase family protein [Caldicoprobacterales bacterium]|jgi:uroporphyrinogen decarboxylase
MMTLKNKTNGKVGDFMIRGPLKRQEVIGAIERKGEGKIPLVWHKWWGDGLEEKYGSDLTEMAKDFPDDILSVIYQAPGEDVSPTENPNYRWGYKPDYSGAERHSIGRSIELLPDWSELDLFLADFPNPKEPGTFDKVKAMVDKDDERYRLGGWWRLYHERLWGIRGMENLMMDYYDNMDGLKIICRHLTDYYKAIVDRFKELDFDGIFTSDDLGHQSGPMMSPEIFEELYFPFYCEIINYVHSRGMHFFLHSCGDNTKLMKYLIEAGVDVFHPVQKGCMDEVETARMFGDRISFLVGVDVQHLLPKGTAQAIRDDIRKIIEIFHKPEGGLLLGAGNGILPDTPIENIRIMLEELSRS